jgi:hypothetical protein
MGSKVMKKQTGQIEYHFEPDSPFLGIDLLEFTLDYTVYPGDPGCRMTRNGDGWPPSPPEVEFEVKSVTVWWQDGESKVCRGNEAKWLVETFERFMEKNTLEKECVESAIIENASDAYESGREEYWEAKLDRERDGG